MNHRVGSGDHSADADRSCDVLLAKWPAPSRVHAFTTLRGSTGTSLAPYDRCNLGLRCGDDMATVVRNRDALGASMELPSSPRWLRQMHGTGVVSCDDNMFVEEPEADAAVTTTPGVVLAILTADCLPVLFHDDDGTTVGAAHAGWRGLVAGVLERTVVAMHAAPEKLSAWLGPAAGPQAYEVGEEVRTAFVDVDPHAASAFVPTRPGHWFCDLHALARLRLASVGITNVHGGGLCTISDPQRFFSHRRDGRTGRMASMIWIDSANPGA